MTDFIPYGRQSIEEEDIAAVVEVLRSDWLTTGPKVAEFEQAVAGFCKVGHAAAVSNGTTALHAVMYAAGIGPGDEVIVPAITFAASANCAAFMGATPVFCDVRSEDLLLDPQKLENKFNERTKALVAVDYAGQPCDYDLLREIIAGRNILLIDDAAHSMGGEYKGRPTGSLADISTFSFHPVKPMTTGEGGMVLSDNEELIEKVRLFRNHCISADFRQREMSGSWHYDVVDLGYNFRLTDIQSALGLSQLKKLPDYRERRCAIARRYDEAFADVEEIMPLEVAANVKHAWHLYVVRLGSEQNPLDRADVFQRMRDAQIGVNVHYVPVHLHTYYRKKFGTKPGLCPIAEEQYKKIISLPIFPGLEEKDQQRVIDTLLTIIGK